MFAPYRITPLIFLALPILSALWLIGRSGRVGSLSATRSYAGICLAGVMLGMSLSLIWSWLLNAQVPLEQTALACYWVIGVLCAIGAFNLLLNRGMLFLLRRLLRGRGSAMRRLTGAAAAGLLIASRAVLLTAVAGGMLAATALSYRPRVVYPGDPKTLLNAGFETVTFRATDGTRLSGWWIPAASDHLVQDTILLCHGFGGDKARDLEAVRELSGHGFNICAFDFRAHGQSGGRLRTFGDLERRDVLGAVRWLRLHHQGEARRILGLGIDIGANALIAAASDPGEDGQAIDAIVAVAPFDNVFAVADFLSQQRALPVAGWILSHLGLPMAGAECGTNLWRWSPAREVQGIWPRPILFVHGSADERIPRSSTEALFENAMQPKYRYWIDEQTTKQALFSDDETARVIRVFFSEARSIL